MPRRTHHRPQCNNATFIWTLKRMVINTLLAIQPRFWNGKSKRSLGIKAAPGRISLSLLRQCSPRRCLTFAPHLKRRQEGGKQRLQTVQNFLHFRCFGQCKIQSPQWPRNYGVHETLRSFSTREAAKPFGRVRHLAGEPAVWFWHLWATSLMCCGQHGAYQQPRHMWPQSVHSLCLTWRQTIERQLMRKKSKARTQMPMFHFRQIKYTKKEETEIICQMLKQPWMGSNGKQLM